MSSFPAIFIGALALLKSSVRCHGMQDSNVRMARRSPCMRWNRWRHLKPSSISNAMTLMPPAKSYAHRAFNSTGNPRMKLGYGARRTSEIQTTMSFAFTTPVRIAAILHGASRTGPGDAAPLPLRIRQAMSGSLRTRSEAQRQCTRDSRAFRLVNVAAVLKAK
jgi:hypothetical protein